MAITTTSYVLYMLLCPLGAEPSAACQTTPVMSMHNTVAECQNASATARGAHGLRSASNELYYVCQAHQDTFSDEILAHAAEIEADRAAGKFDEPSEPKLVREELSGPRKWAAKREGELAAEGRKPNSDFLLAITKDLMRFTNDGKGE